MKNLFALLIVIIFFGNKTATPPKTLSLQAAIDRKLIQVDVSGNTNSPHYSQPLQLKVKNVSTTPFRLQIPNGQRFLTVDEDVQDMILVKSELLALAPGIEKSILLNAMCTQKENGGPGENEPYRIGPMAESHLLQVSNKIQELEAYNTIGQYSVWSISNNVGLESIAGFDDTEAQELQQFVAKITGKKIPEKDPMDYLTNYDSPSLAKRTLGGSFEYGLVKTSAITIGLFNEQNIIVRELLNKPSTPRGDHKMNFEFDMAAYTEPVYIVRLIVDGRIKISTKIET
ncbi:hypothetical protein N9502_00555 [Vicingaceae bacterium]|nr:hypothetical protein [Vicingaceae bacterium]